MTMRRMGVVLAAMGAMLGAQTAAKAAPNYALAEQWTEAKVNQLVFDMSVTPHWFATGDKFWYSYKSSIGTAYYVVDAATGEKAAMFDHAKLAEQLTRLTGLPYDGEHLPIGAAELTDKDTALRFSLAVPRTAMIPGLAAEAAGRGGRGGANAERTIYFSLDLATGQAHLLADYKAAERTPAWAQVSPDGKTVLFARGNNLYMMDGASFALARKDPKDASVKETQLTSDGAEFYSYAAGPRGHSPDDEDLGTTPAGRGAADNSGGRVAAVRVVWSKDGSKFALTRTDERKVADLWVIHSLHNPRPTLETYKYALPGEANVPQSEMWVFDVATGKGTKINAAAYPDQRLSIEAEPGRGAGGRGGFGAPPADGAPPPAAVWLGGDSAHFYLQRVSRDEKKVDYCVASTADGSVRAIIQERANIPIATKPLRLVDHGADLLLWSERDGWGHYYLYGTDGTLKRQLDQGEFVAGNVVTVDDGGDAAAAGSPGTLYFTAMGYRAGEDVYYNHLMRIGLDGTGLREVDPGDADHTIAAGPDGKYFVDTYSRVDTAPESDLYGHAGKISHLETTDVKALLAAGFHYPMPFSVKADDGVTDLYGVMFRPFDFDPQRKYPLIEFVYPGPQTEEVDTTFNPTSAMMDLAQFGFVVIEVGNRGGSPQRDEWYHRYGYGNLRDYGLADKKRAAEELGAEYPWIDLSRVGITGHSGGGFMSTAAMLVYPDFFKVAVSESGNHDNNVYNRNWSEENNGVREVDTPDGDPQFLAPVDENSSLAANLKGHLLLSTGDMDDNVSMANTMRMANALIRANKRFDIFILPGERHHYGSDTAYFFWYKADYFCQWLLGSSPHSADMMALQREQAENGKKAGARVGPPAIN